MSGCHKEEENWVREMGRVGVGVPVYVSVHVCDCGRARRGDQGRCHLNQDSKEVRV